MAFGVTQQLNTPEAGTKAGNYVTVSELYFTQVSFCGHY